MFRSIFTAALFVVASATAINAATYNFIGSFSGSQLGTVNFDVDITADFSADISDTAVGLSVNSLIRSNGSPVDGAPLSLFNSSCDM